MRKRSSSSERSSYRISASLRCPASRRGSEPGRAPHGRWPPLPDRRHLNRRRRRPEVSRPPPGDRRPRTHARSTTRGPSGHLRCRDRRACPRTRRRTPHDCLIDRPGDHTKLDARVAQGVARVQRRTHTQPGDAANPIAPPRRTARDPSCRGSASAADETALQPRMQQSADWTAARRSSSHGRSALVLQGRRAVRLSALREPPS
jgi:hypothetical protein